MRWHITKRLKAFKIFFALFCTLKDEVFVQIFQDNALFAGCGDNNIYMWDLETGMLQVRFILILFGFVSREESPP